MKEAVIYKTIPLEDSEGGTLEFAVIEKPYGEGSKAVVSICASLGGGKESWKVHIPLTQIKESCKALKGAKKARKKCKDAKKKEAKAKEVKKDKKTKVETTKETKTPKK
ncbi:MULTISPECIES: hypothetical protein [Helicobacter]|uniref:Uncharacterized protein n=2 Tax=Helicobacter ganmani TaxID=60246 RepID=A0A3D8IE42_9HELI|nr:MULTISPECIES: hypothetical protein [Helicobacter]RDU63370.1 hypothetical protein CQA43_04400 [Helicobacter ganmani]